MVLLLGLLRRCCPELFRKFALAVFDEGRKFHCAIIRNFDAWRGASNAHRCDGSIDLHIASLRDIAGNESEGPLGQIEHGRIGLPIRVVHELVQSHAGVARKIKRAAIRKVDAEPAIGPGLDHIAQIDEVANVRLTGLTAEICLNDHRTRVFNGDRTRGSYNFPNGP